MKKEQNKKNDEKRKKMLCELFEDRQYVPMKEKELAILLQTEPEDRAELHRLLSELVAEGKAVLTKRGRYQKAQEMLLTGTFISNSKGYGFVQVEGVTEDFFIPEDRTKDAFHLDTVQIVPMAGSDGHGRRTAEVIAVLERGMTQVVGTFELAKNAHFGFLVPDVMKIPQDIFIPVERSKGAVTGQKVVAEITDYGSRNRFSGIRSPEGKVTEILGHINDPGVDILSLIRGYNLPQQFETKVLEQAERVAKPVSTADCFQRRDLRDLRMVTIDGDDAKDLDDAVSISFDGEYYHLGVHIADVTNYVQENSALDREAKKRGTSVYLVDRVIPMLPHILCNGICSLNAGEDRLALSCLMKISQTGEICDYEICESVICVDKRMSYHVVNELLTEPDAEQKEEYREYLPLLEDFCMMDEVAKLLRKKRRERGGIDFDLPECQIRLDEQGRPVDIRPYDRNLATRIIEDFMLAANETVAQHFYWMDVPFVYRVHGAPDADRIKSLSVLISNMGHHIKTLGRSKGKTGGEEIHPKEIQKVLDKIQGTAEEAMISRMVLRSMKQAKYSVECSGHFGLACQYYCHFTSPIRRYPDLQIHRIIKEQLRGKLSEERRMHYREILPEVAESSSRLERRADEAEREVDKLKKVQYMQSRIGEIYDGIVSGITSWGIYVELENTVEGMIHVSKLPGDYFYFSEKTGEMVGEATGKKYVLGMPVRIRVDACDEFARTIDFSPFEETDFD